MKRDLYAEVSARIVAELEAGAARRLIIRPNRDTFYSLAGEYEYF